MASPLARLRRVTDLFVEGKVLPLGKDPDTGDDVMVWVKKPNSFERTECQRDGLFDQAKYLAVLTKDSDEIRPIIEDAQRRGIDSLIDSMLDQRRYEFMHKARQDVEADPEWRERMPLIERSSLAGDGSQLSDAEKEAVAKAGVEYVDAITAAADEHQQAARRELSQESPDDVLDQYIEGYRNLRGMAAFDEGYRITEMFYALRTCDATWDADAERWVHDDCKHERLCEKRQQIRDLPDGLMARVMETLREVMATPAEAGNSDAPSTSSESSEQPSSAEDSTPSTPTAT